MAKNKSFFNKIVTVTAAVAAVGGVCYVFRDKIKNSSLYKLTLDKLSNLYERQGDDFDEDFEDFSFDDDDTFDEVFSEGEKSEREYTSITINAKEETQEETSKETAEEATDGSIPTIDFTVKESEEPEVLSYENEGLSDVSEDPDVLEEQDKLDF